MKSTSFHKLNADFNRTPLRKKLWKLLNFANISFFPRHAKDLVIKDFSPHITDHDLENIERKASPGRALSNLFWSKLNWPAIQEELGEIRVFDVGCGSGNYALRLQTFSENRITSYCGGDSAERKNWNKLTAQHPFITLKKLNSHDTFPFIPGNTNFFMSQSAIEHFEEDLVFFQHIRQYIINMQKSVIQIHLFPSRIHCYLSPLHGVRVYTPRMVSTIARTFEGLPSYSILFNLGGNYCNTLHDQFITQPLYQVRDRTLKRDRRETETALYENLLRNAILQDNRSERIIEPHFYALVIHSNYNKPVFTSMMKTLTNNQNP